MADGPEVTVYGDDCDECMQTRSYLERHSVQYGERDVIAEPLTAEELIELALNADGIDELAGSSIREEVAEMEEDDIAEFLAADPTRVAHPIITTDEQIFVGFDDRVRDVFAESP